VETRVPSRTPKATDPPPAAVSAVRTLLDEMARVQRGGGECPAVARRVKAACLCLPTTVALEAIKRAAKGSKGRQEQSIIAYAVYGRHKAASAYAAELLATAEESVRDMAVQLIGAHGLRAFAPLLNPFLEDPDYPALGWAVIAAGELRADANYPALRALALDKAYRDRMARGILWSMKNYARPDARGYFNEVRRSARYPEDKLIATWALARMGDAGAMKELVKALSDDELDMRAAQAICDVRGLPFEWDLTWVHAFRSRFLSSPKK
jgi:HEAT repeat protein